MVGDSALTPTGGPHASAWGPWMGEGLFIRGNTKPKPHLHHSTRWTPGGWWGAPEPHVHRPPPRHPFLYGVFWVLRGWLVVCWGVHGPGAATYLSSILLLTSVDSHCGRRLAGGHMRQHPPWSDVSTEDPPTSSSSLPSPSPPDSSSRSVIPWTTPDLSTTDCLSQILYYGVMSVGLSFMLICFRMWNIHP